MNIKKKLEALEKHFNLSPSSSASLQERSGAVKKKAGMQNDSIDIVYDAVINKKGKVPVIAVGDKPADKKDDKPKEVEILPPVKSDLKVEGAAQRVEVAAPVIQVSTAPAQLVVNHGNLSWAYTLQRAVMYGFVFASGTMFGVLAALAKMKGAI